MTTHDRPHPPTDIDRELDEVLDELERRDADTLRDVSSYLEDLAAWKAAGTDDEGQSAVRRDSGDGDGDGDDTPDATETAIDDLEYPSDVPERASVTVKEIAGTTYHYYQWRDGDRIESKTVER